MPNQQRRGDGLRVLAWWDALRLANEPNERIVDAELLEQHKQESAIPAKSRRALRQHFQRC